MKKLLNKDDKNNKTAPATDQSLFNMQEFYEWLCGLTDGEGNFYFVFSPLRLCSALEKRKGSANSYQFFFQIQLHIDDFHALLHIRYILGLGRVSEFKNTCIFRVDNIEDIKKIIKIYRLWLMLRIRRIYFK